MDFFQINAENTVCIFMVENLRHLVDRIIDGAHDS